MREFSFKNQAELLIEVMDRVFEDSRIALKGGTAINFFFQDMPRYSVDLDLAYLPIESRADSLKNIDDIFVAIAQKLSVVGDLDAEVIRTKEGNAKQINITRGNVPVKVEINHVLRGSVYSPTITGLCTKAQDIFKQYVEVPVESYEDLYAGKFCAALDRQHPRDLFDVMVFLQKHQITERLRKAFLIYLIGNNRPISELIHPNLLDQRILFEQEFQGMTDYQVQYEQLEEARVHLIELLSNSLTDNDRSFLLSVKKMDPKWNLLDIDGVEKFPAIQWKLKNIQKMQPAKHKAALDELKRKLEM